MNPTSATKVKILLPIWGEDFIRRYAKLSLPTLLAPGNIPALSAEFPCEFIFLINAADEVFFKELPAYKVLGKYCKISFIHIDDLITEGNYSVTITLAFERAIRAQGEEMIETYFLSMVSDYIMADGSLRGLIKYMNRGVSGVLAGNFQIKDEGLERKFNAWRDAKKSTIVIPPRDLLRFAFGRMHNVTIANIVNQPISHANHCNRLFWQVDENTLLGRFFLMHALCIRPETTDFKVGSSCDYSFIPEMCPSGNVVRITDSDEYLVVEMQRSSHELDYVQQGNFRLKDLADHMSEWTTKQHRDNAHHTVLFHSDDIPVTLEGAEAEAAEYVGKVFDGMSPNPQPHRGHPYWLGAMIAFELSMEGQGRENEIEQLMLDDDRFSDKRRFYRFMIGVYRFVMGDPPEVRPFYHFWHDYAPLLRRLKKELSDPGHSMLVLSGEPNAFSNWLSGFGGQVFGQRTTKFLERPRKKRKSQKREFDSCFIHLTSQELVNMPKILDRLGTLLKPGGKVHLFIPGKHESLLLESFSMRIAHSADIFFRPDFRILDCHFAASYLQIISLGILDYCAGRFQKKPLLYFPLVVLLLVPAYLMVGLDNLFRHYVKGKQGGYCSSVSLTMELQ